MHRRSRFCCSILTTLLCALTLAGCNKPADPAPTAAPAATTTLPTASSAPATDDALADTAEQVVPQFHLNFMDSAYAAIYDSAAPEFRLFRQKHEFIAYMESIRKKMGVIQGAERIGASNNGMTVTLRYKSSYANGPATEEFIVHVSGSSAALVGYRMVSPPIL
jgi:hypothetical protein